ncbi:hypothetical protein BDZ97DRAFT_1866591, partial [Flammula alnicola]
MASIGPTPLLWAELRPNPALCARYPHCAPDTRIVHQVAAVQRHPVCDAADAGFGRWCSDVPASYLPPPPEYLSHSPVPFFYSPSTANTQPLKGAMSSRCAASRTPLSPINVCDRESWPL